MRSLQRHYTTNGTKTVTSTCCPRRSIFTTLFGSGSDHTTNSRREGAQSNSSGSCTTTNSNAMGTSGTTANPLSSTTNGGGGVVSDAVVRRPFPSGVDASKGAFVGNFPADGATMEAGKFHNNVPVARVTDTVADVSELLTMYDLGCVPVLDAGNRLVGMISERDLARWISRAAKATVVVDGDKKQAGEEALGGTTTIQLPLVSARELMSAKVITCQADTALSEALRLMYKHNFRHLPVVADGDDTEVVGLLSMRDIITQEQRGKDAGDGDVDDFMKWVLRMSS